MIKAILMDFNGVIIDDERIQMRIYQELMKADGIDLTEDDYFASLGMDDRTFVRSNFERKAKACDEAVIDRIASAKSVKWREAVSSQLPLFEGIRDFIEKAAKGFALGIVSMSGRVEIDHVLDIGGLRKFFATVVSAEDVGSWKPDPECYRIGFRRIDLHRIAQGHLPMVHGDCLVIEDSPPGVAAARAADLPVLGVANTVSADDLRRAGAGAVAKDLRDWMPESLRRVFV